MFFFTMADYFHGGLLFINQGWEFIKRKQENKKTRKKERKQELDQEIDQEKKDNFSWSLSEVIVFFLVFSFS